MADTDEPVFENDQQMEEYFADPERSECLSSTLDVADAVSAVNKGHADFIRYVAEKEKWAVHRLYPRFEGYRCAVIKMTKRYHRLSFDKSYA